MEKRLPQVGDHIIFVDTKGQDHNALVTIVYSDDCINGAYVSGDESQQDSYGRQVHRTATCMRATTPGMVHGNHWRFPEDPKMEVQVPMSK